MIYNVKNKIRNAANSNKIVSKIYNKANYIKVNLLSILSDETYAKIKFKENTGRKLNLDKPRTFNEKLWWLKINNRDPLLTICSDKVNVRDYVAEKGFKDILVPIVGIYEKVEDISFHKIPDNAFIKTNHGSGTNLIWTQEKDSNKIKNVFNKALKQNYYLQSREWNYKNIQPKIIIEENLKNLNNNLPMIDYKFLCFDGKVELLYVDLETASKDGTHNPNAKRNIYNRDFNKLDIKVKRDNFDKDLISKPQNFEKMIQIAEKLSSEFVFCRVDLYNFNGKIYFGEITFYTGGATQIFEPEDWEIKLGDLINLDSDKIKKKRVNNNEKLT